MNLFPFFFGRGLQRTGSIKEKKIRHMMFLYIGRFATCDPLIFLLLDQLHRHEATRVISSRVKCSPVSFETFTKQIVSIVLGWQKLLATPQQSHRSGRCKIDAVREVLPSLDLERKVGAGLPVPIESCICRATRWKGRHVRLSGPSPSSLFSKLSSGRLAL